MNQKDYSPLTDASWFGKWEKNDKVFLHEFGSPELEALVFLIKMFVVVDIVNTWR